jgi:hypothetical protein
VQPDRHRWLAQPLAVCVISAGNVVLRSDSPPSAC